MIDSFFRIKALHDIGVKVHLHCFGYGRDPSPVLESICESVNYYKRDKGFLRQLSALPFIVNSRRSKELAGDLGQNDFPVLFDGLHTAFLIDNKSLSGRKKYVRLHNIEHNYYMSRSAHE
jgi:hypothetical protein